MPVRPTNVQLHSAGQLGSEPGLFVTFAAPVFASETAITGDAY
jgi:hypothetical protein